MMSVHWVVPGLIDSIERLRDMREPERRDAYERILSCAIESIYASAVIAATPTVVDIAVSDLCNCDTEELDVADLIDAPELSMADAEWGITSEVPTVRL